MQPAFCPQCGAARIAEMNFCASCGFNLTQLPAVTAAGVQTSRAAPDAGASAIGRSLDGNLIVQLLGGALVVIGSFLPWATIYSGLGAISISGIDRGGDALFTLLLGIGIIAVAGSRLLGLADPSRAVRFWSPFVAGLLAVGVAVLDYVNVSQSIDENLDGAVAAGSVGAGIYVIGVGGLLSTLAALRSFTRRDAEPLRQAGWWRVLESDYPQIPAKESVYLEFVDDALLISRVIGEPVAEVSYSEGALVAAGGHDEVAVAFGDWSAVLRRSGHAPTSDRLIAAWRSRAE